MSLKDAESVNDIFMDARSFHKRLGFDIDKELSRFLGRKEGRKARTMKSSRMTESSSMR